MATVANVRPSVRPLSAVHRAPPLLALIAKVKIIGFYATAFILGPSRDPIGRSATTATPPLAKTAQVRRRRRRQQVRADGGKREEEEEEEVGTATSS